MAGKVVKMTPATKPMHSTPFQSTTKKRRVAAYARVSTDKEEQESSFDAQVSYYTRLIKSNPEWIFVEVYSDEGVTGTSMKKREGFTRMINDALAGRIDLILTKSVSRFARNTVDTLTTVRKLKDKGVEVYFEKENIYTLDSKGEIKRAGLLQTSSIGKGSKALEIKDFAELPCFCLYGDSVTEAVGAVRRKAW